jgi:hypothetical protein
VRTPSKVIEVFGNAIGFRLEGTAMPEFRTRARPRTGVRLAVHCRAVLHERRSESAGVTKEDRAFARRGVEPRERGAVEHMLCVNSTAAEYAHLVWLRAMQAVCTAVRCLPTSARSAAAQRGEHGVATGIAGGFRCQVRPNTSLKRSANGRPPGPRGGSVYHPPRGPGVLPSSPA